MSQLLFFSNSWTQSTHLHIKSSIKCLNYCSFQTVAHRAHIKSLIKCLNYCSFQTVAHTYTRTKNITFAHRKPKVTHLLFFLNCWMQSSHGSKSADWVERLLLRPRFNWIGACTNVSFFQYINIALDSTESEYTNVSFGIYICIYIYIYIYIYTLLYMFNAFLLGYIQKCLSEYVYIHNIYIYIYI